MKVITSKEAAALLRVDVDSVYALAQLGPKKGGIPSLRNVGSRLRFDQDALEAWLKSGQGAGERS